MKKPCLACESLCHHISLAFEEPVLQNDLSTASRLVVDRTRVLRLCGDCRRKACALLEMGHTPAQIALERTDIQNELEEYHRKFLESKPVV